MKLLFVIPARGGSKGIPGKNIKPLHGQPLILYSVAYARLFTNDKNICVSTDSRDIKQTVESFNLSVPFLRPAELATDTAGTFDVLKHAVNYYEEQGLQYEALVLLQPTSPLREKKHLEEALKEYNNRLDMVVSVKESSANPYYNLFEEDKQGKLVICKGDGQYTRRQDVPPVYEYNGSIYIINIQSIKQKKSFKDFSFVRKYVMEDAYSIDLDSPSDWEYAEYLMQKKK
jgi:CMP-N,N'-diacetyllegionaminic acid synthase